MPEYLSPGVYIVEVKGNVHPIEGVPTSTADLLDPDCLARLRAKRSALAPSWSDGAEHDPGVALLELAAWLAETTLARLDRVPDRAALAYMRLLAASLHALEGQHLPPHGFVHRVARRRDAHSTGRD
jgi:phage tail sheath protein FI